MPNYIDGFLFSIPRKHLNEYKVVAEKVAAIWKEYGAISYNEFLGDDMNLPGTKSFPEVLNATENDAIIFGWVSFQSREARDLANQKVAGDSRMESLVAPLADPRKLIFDASKMAFGGLSSFINV